MAGDNKVLEIRSPAGHRLVQGHPDRCGQHHVTGARLKGNEAGVLFMPRGQTRAGAWPALSSVCCPKESKHRRGAPSPDSVRGVFCSYPPPSLGHEAPQAECQRPACITERHDVTAKVKRRTTPHLSSFLPETETSLGNTQGSPGTPETKTRAFGHVSDWLSPRLELSPSAAPC